MNILLTKGDAQSVPITLKDANGAWDLTGSTVVFKMSNSEGTITSINCTLGTTIDGEEVTAAQGGATIPFTTTHTATVANYVCWVEVTKNGSPVTFPSAGYIEVRVTQKDLSPTYCTIEDVYRKTELTSNDISESSIYEHILDAQSEVNEWYNTSFLNSVETTEWFDTREDELITIPEPNINLVYLTNTPVQEITSMEEYDGTNTKVRTWAATEYWLNQDTGEVRLISDVFGKQFHRLKVVYKYGFTEPPRIVRRLTMVIASLSVLVERMGGTYYDLSSYTLPTGVTVDKTEPYEKISKSIVIIKEELDRLKATIGEHRPNAVVI